MTILKVFAIIAWVFTVALSVGIIRYKPVLGIALTVIQYCTMFIFFDFLDKGFCITLLISFFVLMAVFAGILPKKDFAEFFGKENNAEQVSVSKITPRSKSDKQYDLVGAQKKILEDPMQYELDVLDPESNAWIFEDRDEFGNLK